MADYSSNQGHDFAEDEEEETISADLGGSYEENKLDEAMGVIQDVLIDPSFVQMQNDFCETHCDCFDDASENKLIYMDLFREYTNLIENFLEARLKEAIDDFSMDALCSMIQEHEDEMTGDVIDVLMSCADFDEFKSLMLSFKSHQATLFQIHGDSLVCG
ncbi:hypothetical protein SPRG_09444 [Saprolegnia parasitica CBS 223.65]|uniref:ADP-ribosylation factor-like protein 2-binding protein n=1 Tax=Saprolegnia parasitica (strain CBS 223.65) TaxID=695850 RepID=A0A067C7S1_SAPPC|nr:hypothetical protein SPRG_09444 [Saprolegnia parasitica CBS 223.65]KDO25170.1 hypothetical protein SPRG_09444 [Saprolegnia parasitica CBS 223.65]|eukprot:XP_012204036.1 hypothetical protein SPRG_09444 [Saprolegnia parasitica CBS 223.65]